MVDEKLFKECLEALKREDALALQGQAPMESEITDDIVKLYKKSWRNSMLAKFAPERIKKFELICLDFRVPKRNELYIDKNMRVQRLKEDRVQSKRAKPRLIVRENF